MGKRIFSVILIIMAVTVLAVEIILPLRVIVLALTDASGGLTLKGLSAIVATANARALILRSVVLGVIVSLITTVLASCTALALLFRLRVRPVVILLFLPLFMSGTQTGLAQSQLAQHLQALPTYIVLVCSLSAYALPFALISFIVASRHISRSLLDSGMELAAGKAGSILRLILPMTWPAVAAAATVAFLIAINEGTRTFQLASEPLIATYVDGKMAGGADPLTYAIATVLYVITASLIALGTTMRSKRLP